MHMRPASTPGTTAVDAVPAEDLGGAASASVQARLRELFRLWIDEGHVHPLIHIMRRYRAAGRE
jgi:hypothetical protein